MGQLENVFSWSKTRDEKFRECPRKYFYDTYASWGGWDTSAPKEMRMAYVLKNLKNRWAWKGETVHHVIEDVMKSLRAGRPVPLEDALALLTERMRKDYRASKAKKNWEDPKRNVGLFEHEYEKPIGDPVWKRIHEESSDCLRNFYRSHFFGELVVDDKASWAVIEDLEDFTFDGAKVFVKLDFARMKDGKVEIYDWKTGKNDPSAATVQMGAYAIYAMGKWKLPVTHVRAFLVNLSTPFAVPEEQKIDAELIARAEAVMRESIAGMRGLLADAAKNTPKAPAEFAYARDPRTCEYCNFHKMCERFAGLI